MKTPRRVSPRANAREASRRSGVGRLSLQSFLPYRLNVLAQAVSGGFSVQYWERFGLLAPEWRILATLGELGKMTAKEISDHSMMHKATVSRAVLALEKRQLLVRIPSIADRREAVLSLSADGRRIYETLVPMALRYEQGLLEGLSRGDQAKLDRLIRHLMERTRLVWAGAADSEPAEDPTKSEEDTPALAKGRKD